MFKSLVVALGFSTVLLSCVHSREYAHSTIALSPAAQSVILTTSEQADSCQKAGRVVGKGQARQIEEAVAAAMKDGQNKAGSQEGANTMLYLKTEAQKVWRTYFIDIEFNVYTCANAAVVHSATVQASSSAEAQISIQAQTAAQAASIAASQAAAQAASQAAVQASQAAAQAASQAAVQASQAASQAAAQAASQAAMHAAPMNF